MYLGLCYLVDGSFEKSIIRLVFYDPEEERLLEFKDEGYKPYFFVNHPLEVEDEESFLNLHARTSTAEKINLFTGEVRTLTRIELEDPSLIHAASRLFKTKWEDEVPYVLSYLYDHGIVFGAPYMISNKPIPMLQVDESLKTRFQEKFSVMRNGDPQKYEMLEYWFKLCSQPVPEMPLQKIGFDVDYERLYLAFMLSRIANVPLPSTLANSRVSTWIKSILHCYLRKKNILIPMPSELRRGEPLRSVPGALTFPPRAGIYFNTVVLDFESLYPSIIDSYNLSYETVDCQHEECRINHIPGVDHHVCAKKRGVYSILIGALRDLRIRWFKPYSKDPSLPKDERCLAEAASKLLKLILVASYGVTVRIHGLAQPALAESITAYGRYALRESWNLAEVSGLRPIYGDTDSLFLDNPSENDVQELIGKVKNKLRLDLAVDKVYSVCVLSRAMKAYFGVQKDGESDIKGLTAIKSNSPKFIQNVFKECAGHLVNVNNWAEFEEAKEKMRQTVKRAVANLRAGKVSLSELEYTVRLHLEPSKKFVSVSDETLHQPYQSAIQFINLRKDLHQGETVSFIKVKPFSFGGKTFTVKPTELVRDLHEVNVDDYVRNLISALNLSLIHI